MTKFIKNKAKNMIMPLCYKIYFVRSYHLLFQFWDNKSYLFFIILKLNILIKQCCLAKPSKIIICLSSNEELSSAHTF